MKTPLLLILLFCGTASMAQDAKSLVGKWRTVKMVTIEGSAYKIEQRVQLFDLLLDEARSEAIHKAGYFSKEDSVEAVKKTRRFLMVLFDSKHIFNADGSYTFETWKESNDWKPTTIKGNYLFDAKAKRLKVATPDKTFNYTVSQEPEGMKLALSSIMYIVLAPAN